MDQNRYPAWRVIKYGTEFNRMIEDVADVVTRTKKSLSAADYEANKARFEGVTKALDQVSRTRYVDHSYYLIERLKRDIPEIDIKSEKTGFKQYVKAGDVERQVDSYEFMRQETIDANKDKIDDFEGKMQRVYDDFYANDKHAKEHIVVMQSFEMANNKIKDASCGT